ncbi:Cation/H(+) antiporter 15 [Rhynchospora pubera]|uniref:Cation/H(+) antiporter 15 n=1 Tax=Rhynchospora pubera TaxID=906938 RepID=A0AAV8DN20_9POAL|nr:Cation/H(+) antiporter 15 [Rhynchospora pubera]
MINSKMPVNSPPQPLLFDIEYTNMTACYQEGDIVSAVGEWILQYKTRQDFTYVYFNSMRTIDSQSKDYNDPWPVNISAFLPHALLSLVMIVIISRGLHFFLRRLKQPLFVSQMMAGILIYQFCNVGRRVDSIDYHMLFQPKNRRLEQSLSNIGIFFNFFLMALKVDISSIWLMGKKPFIIGIISLSIPSMVTFIVYFFIRNLLGYHVKSKHDFSLPLLAMLCHSFFFVQAEVLSELGLLSSELGRLALSTSIIQDLIFWILTPVFNSMTQSQYGEKNVILHLLFFAIMVAFIILVIRPYALWVVRNTPSHARVREVHITMITLLVILMALASDIVGASYIVGPMLMGFALPSGPPLGTALVGQIDLVATELLLPLVYIVAGREMDWTAAGQDPSHGLCLGIMVLIASITKFATVAISAAYCGLPLKNGVLLGLIMDFKGIMETLILIYFKSGRVINGATYTYLILVVVAMTSISSLLVSIFYKPLDMENNVCKNVRDLSCQSELRIITCFFDDKPIPALLDFFEWLTSLVAQHCTCIYALHLKELRASSRSSLVCHHKGKEHTDKMNMDPILNHFATFAQQKKEKVTVMPFTSVVPQTNLHEDICSLVVERKIALVIVPSPRKNSVAYAESDQSVRDLIPLVLEQAQCSVGIMVYHNLTRVASTLQGHQFCIGVVFIGGPDDREVIAIAGHMAYHPSVQLNILHFRIPCIIGSKRSDLVELCVREQKLDDQVIDQLQRENAHNDRLAISEVAINDPVQIMDVIHPLGYKYDLLLVGRRHKHLSILESEALVEWTEWPELGVIGDLLASPDFKTSANILVVQQHGFS